MELADIERLLKRYENGSTSLEEEKLLQEYFTSNNNVAPHLKEYVIVFSYFKNSKEEKYERIITLNNITDNSIKKYKWISIAASIAIIFSSYIGYNQYKKQQQKKKYAKVKEALQLLSTNLNRGNEVLYNISENINQGNEAIEKLYTYENTVHKIIDNTNLK